MPPIPVNTVVGMICRNVAISDTFTTVLATPRDFEALEAVERLLPPISASSLSVETPVTSFLMSSSYLSPKTRITPDEGEHSRDKAQYNGG